MAGSGGNSNNDVVPNEKFRDLSRNIRSEWKEIAGCLTLTDGTVYQIELDNRTVKEQIYQMLVTWKQKKGKNATYGVLSQALRKVERDDLADSLGCCHEEVTRTPGQTGSESTNRLPKEEAFRSVLVDIAKKLRKNDIRSLVFQCPQIPPADMESIEDGVALFDEMRRYGILTVERLEELFGKLHLAEPLSLLEDFKRRYDKCD